MNSPVLFLIFKREDVTRRVFERICEAKPPRLYIAADGPRPNHPDEMAKCEATRKVVDRVDWPCEIHRLYHNTNLGCGRGVSEAITWFFEHEEQGIIIEDDILPHIDFFRYCDEMLERYKDNERVQLISGYNYFFEDFPSDVSYYMSSYMHIWGWASWRRVWQTYQFDLNKYPKSRMQKMIRKRLCAKSARYFLWIYSKMQQMEIDTWDYQLSFNQYYYDRYSICPFINMVENIGMGSKDATHTTNEDLRISGHKAQSPYPIKHPQVFYTSSVSDAIDMMNNGQVRDVLIVRFLKRIYNKLI